jgi:glyoxylase-like metal-dependent hydrolase (beta-lactamase superfamily II)
MAESTQVYTAPMGNNVWLIDLMEQNLPGRTSAYLILDDAPTLVETGSARSHDILLRGMKQLGIEPKDLQYVIVTHVHLDHAGGAGQMMQLAPEAKLVVHPRGARHMKDPSRLWEGARSVYGDALPDLFGSVIPVPEEQILIRDHEETLNIGSRELTFFDSPGHAKHHFTILDPVSQALFAGDAVGIRYATRFTGWDFEWVMPSSSPVDFDPDAVKHTMQMLEQVPFQWVYHAHFGNSPKEEAIRETNRCAQAFAKLAAQAYRPDLTATELETVLRGWFRDDLTAQGFDVPGDMSVLNIDIILDAMGLLYYEKKRRLV